MFPMTPPNSPGKAYTCGTLTAHTKNKKTNIRRLQIPHATPWCSVGDVQLEIGSSFVTLTITSPCCSLVLADCA